MKTTSGTLSLENMIPVQNRKVAAPKIMGTQEDLDDFRKELELLLKKK